MSNSIKYSNATYEDAQQEWKLTAPDFENGIHERRVSPDGKRFVGIYQVLYGYRIRAGYVGSSTVEIDWCCGDVHAMVVLTYQMALTCLYIGIPFNELPSYSVKKPWYKDNNFCYQLGDIMAKYDI